MQTKTFRAGSMQAALDLVRHDLGPDAAVLQARNVRAGLLGWMLGSHQVEVVASAHVNVPSRMPQRTHATQAQAIAAPPASLPPAHEQDYGAKFRHDLKGQLPDLESLVENLCGSEVKSASHELPESLFRLFTDLIDAELNEDLARELIDRVAGGLRRGELDDPLLLKARLTRMVEDEINVTGPLQLPSGKARLVALVGPTGVGKTTTIAKLAANYRLREKRRVGLITVDTYRIAAVDQLRTYADIIDLPMEVVSTPREMREAVARLRDLDLVLMDTAGRSPRDEVRIQELKSMLNEARPDEVHLVLSSMTGSKSLAKTAQRFCSVGATCLLLTKLDEATGLGNLLHLIRESQLPLSYLTNGQNVPDDIRPAERREVARMVLGMEDRER